MTVERLLPTPEAHDLIDLVRQVADKVLEPIVDRHEREHTYPEGVFKTLGDAGLLSLPQPIEWGGGGQPFEVYLQMLEELAARWAAVAVAVSVHNLACHPLLTFGSKDQRRRWLPDMLGGATIGAYSLSEPDAGSDAAALRCQAVRTADGYTITGTKAWITHGSLANFYTLFARTGEGSRGISCFLVPGDTAGLTFGPPEDKMGLNGVPTTSAFYDAVELAEDRRIGEEGQGLSIAFSALDSGRLGIAAVAVGIAQAALDEAVSYAQQRTAFGRRIIDHQGLGFVLADMAAAVDSARAAYLDAARRRDAGMPYSRGASVAKLVATDAAMKVTTDAVQVLGGYGYTREYRVERYMREAKITQIFEGTNQIQRLVISRQLSATAGTNRGERPTAAGTQER
ncbi:acyl-CoA dehydrogenase family protein [Mycobacterium sp. pR1184]|uniref:acyl-CoA dehydrogenase family protein n=1 Tax=Mycobacterium sp. pR1184 TaxID=3238981 RepID=UPI00351B6607